MKREASIAAATSGGDYSVYIRDLAARRQEAQRLAAVRAEYVAVQRAGFNRARERGEVQGTFRDPR